MLPGEERVEPVLGIWKRRGKQAADSPESGGANRDQKRRDGFVTSLEVGESGRDQVATRQGQEVVGPHILIVLKVARGRESGLGRIACGAPMEYADAPWAGLLGPVFISWGDRSPETVRDEARSSPRGVPCRPLHDRA